MKSDEPTVALAVLLFKLLLARGLYELNKLLLSEYGLSVLARKSSKLPYERVGVCM